MPTNARLSSCTPKKSASRSRAEVGDQRIVGVGDEACCWRCAAPAPSCRRSRRARRSGRAGRERGCRAGSRAGVAARRAPQARARRPRTGRARRRSLRAGARRRAAWWRCRPPCSRRPGCARARSARARRSRRPSRLSLSCRWSPRSARCRVSGARRAWRSRCGSRRISTFPGALVAPPPRSRESAPTARASERASKANRARHHAAVGNGERERRRGVPSAGTSICTAPRCARTRSGSSPIGSPSAYSTKGGRR